MQSMKWAHWHHAGAIGFGSGIHTLIRLTIEYFLNEADKMRNSDNPVNVCLGYCICYCCIPLEGLTEYLGKSAYAYCAITGNSYCQSAWNSFLVNIKHLSQFYLANQLAAYFV